MNAGDRHHQGKGEQNAQALGLRLGHALLREIVLCGSGQADSLAHRPRSGPVERVSSAMNVTPSFLAAGNSVLIVGGGLVGASLAIALDAAGVAATLVEAAAPRTDAQPSYDERNLALARATVNGLDAIGVWRHAAARANPIEHIHVSRSGEFGSARIDADRQGVDALGWTLPARELGAALLRRLDECTRLTRLAPASLVALEPIADGWRADIKRPTACSASRHRCWSVPTARNPSCAPDWASTPSGTITSRPCSSAPSHPSASTATARTSVLPTAVRWLCCRWPSAVAGWW